MTDSTDTKPKKKRRSKKKKASAATAADQAPRKASIGCGFREPGCEGERVHDWARARETVRGMVRTGKLKLCMRHLAMLDGGR